MESLDQKLQFRAALRQFPQAGIQCLILRVCQVLRKGLIVTLTLENDDASLPVSVPMDLKPLRSIHSQNVLGVAVHQCVDRIHRVNSRFDLRDEIDVPHE